MSGDPPRRDAPEPETQRLDKWLWAARFFKTRSSAAQSIAGGKVHLDGARVKPAKRIGPAARLEIRRGDNVWHVVVRGLSRHRRPAPEAALLYEETPESAAARRARAEARRTGTGPRVLGAPRPTKRDRRQLDRLTGR